MPLKINFIKNDKGTAMIVALAFLAVLMIMTTTFVVNVIHSSRFESGFEARTKSLYIAEAGLNHAIWKLDEEGESYGGESGVSFGEGTFDVEISAHPEDAARKIVISRARLDGYPRGKTEAAIRAVVEFQAPEAGGFDMVVVSWEPIR